MKARRTPRRAFRFLQSALGDQQFDTLRRLNKEESLTVLVVEQNANMALSLSHRGYVLQQGEIVLQGDSKKLLRDEQMRLAYLT